MLQKLLDKKNRKGFTMIEMLIVVAIIAILIAIAIPMYMGMLEKSRETADLANIRSAYAEAMVYALDKGNGEGLAIVMNIQQTETGWNKVTDAMIHNYTTSESKVNADNYIYPLPAPKKGEDTGEIKYIVHVVGDSMYIGYARVTKIGEEKYTVSSIDGHLLTYYPTNYNVGSTAG